jgi:acyl carrier protein
MVESISPQLRQIVADVFGIAASDVTPQLGVGTLEQWDSLGHLQLMLAIESEFGTQFDPRRIPLLITVQLITDELERRAAVAA